MTTAQVCNHPNSRQASRLRRCRFWAGTPRDASARIRMPSTPAALSDLAGVAGDGGRVLACQVTCLRSGCGPSPRLTWACSAASWSSQGTQAFCWEIGIALLPEWRGQGIGWRAQAIFCSYLFENTPVQRIEAATHAENAAEQRSLEKAGFALEGVVRAAEFRAGQWRDGYLYSRLRTDPDPLGD